MADTTVPVPLSFDHAVLDTPATGKAQIVSASTKPLTATAQVDTTTGAFTIQPSDFSLPSYSFTSPVPGTASIALNGPASGTVDFTTGALTMNADFITTITISGEGSCAIDSGALTLSTATTSPLAGQAFPAGATGVATGDGAFGAGWSTLAPGTGSACTLLNGAVDGPGGIWISRGISPVPAVLAPKLSVKVAKPAAVTVGKTATVKVTLANTGGALKHGVKVCLAAKSPLSPTSRCVTSKPGAKSSRNIAFKLDTAKAKAGTYRLILSVSGKKQSLALTVTK